jgi:hypothetical protein
MDDAPGPRVPDRMLPISGCPLGVMCCAMQGYPYANGMAISCSVTGVQAPSSCAESWASSGSSSGPIATRKRHLLNVNSSLPHHVTIAHGCRSRGKLQCSPHGAAGRTPAYGGSSAIGRYARVGHVVLCIIYICSYKMMSRSLPVAQLSHRLGD